MERPFFSKAADFAAFGIPLVLGVFTASPEPYWLDSPEFTAAAQTLGIPHPPGHPLYVMLVKPFTLLPLGGIALRVALASAVFGALATLLLQRLIRRVVSAVAPDVGEGGAALIAVAAALVAAVAPHWWFQCVRAEVYSLEILLVLAVFYPVALFCLDPSRQGERLLYAAGFAAGLGLTNHHYIMLVALPAAIPPLVAEVRYRGGLGALKLAAKAGGVMALGLLPYAFLPLRSASGAAVSLGGVRSLGDFAWVVSAKVYQKSMTNQYAEPLTGRSFDTVLSMMGEIGPVVLVAALLGIYFLLRRRHTRLTGVVLALLVAVTTLLRAVMGSDPFNPDYYGYMLPVVAALAVGFAAFAAVAVDVIGRSLPRGRTAGLVLMAALNVLPLSRARSVYPDVDLSRFRASRLLVDMSLTRAEPNTLVLAFYYKLFFVLWSARFVDGARPDVAVVNPYLLTYPGYLAATLEEHPDLGPLARAVLVRGALTEGALTEIAWQRPIRLEPQLDLDAAVVSYLTPDGPVYRVSAEPTSRADIAAAAPDHFEQWRRFYHLVGPSRREHETWRMLSWCHFQDAVFFARRGIRPSAKEAIAMAKALGNRAPELDGLEQALGTGEGGPIDVGPFIPGRAPAPPESADEKARHAW